MKLRSTARQFAIAVIVAITVSASAADKPTRPIPAIEHVLLISIDGLRPDLALRANMPTLRGMLRDGAYTFWAKTTAVSITLPSHTSMTTGVTPGKHGITWNSDLPFSKPVYPGRPTVMEMARQAGYITAMVAGKSKFATLNKPGTITHAVIPAAANSASDDSTVAAEAEKLIAAHKPDLLFVHFPDIDGAGHENGWGSAQQIATIEQTDGQLARIFAALARAGIRSSTLVILSADHGGAGFTHGAEDARSRHIPWIAVGPGVKRGYDLTQLADLEIHTEDSAATICYLLGLPRPAYFDGKPVLSAFER
jgi:predicted AlkP superfamily pyrophosphatase or phosphodiesterase